MTIKKKLHIYNSEVDDLYIIAEDLRAWAKKELKGTKIGNPHIHLGYIAAKAIEDLKHQIDSKEEYLREIKRAVETLRNI
jgi:hypothetical protein